ncbi:PREDICTED: uncharacterized protein LOC105564750, partial [Vollenhovia emeryi]|uniref:uncharacterized protein LOC105564750 n=1 Tax=Vollenhovia emeryi TaxID=411798 RepID=UPI0005F4B0CA
MEEDRPPTSEVGSEEQMLEEENLRSTGRNTLMSGSVTLSDMEAFFSKLMSNTSGTLNALPNLVRFDPDDVDADIEGWCNVNEIIVRSKRLDGTDLLLALTRALRGRAASVLMKLKSDQITWNYVKDLLLSKFSKPMMMQDYFDRILKFQINQKETAADAAVRLWGLIEAVPKLHMSEEVIVGFAISILSHHDQTIRRELNANIISTRSQLCRILRGITLKRRHDETETDDNKRLRPSVSATLSAFRGSCHRCGEMGHKSFSCPQNRRDSSLSTLQSSNHKPTARQEDKRLPICYICSKSGHLANSCPEKRENKGKSITKEVNLCDRKAAQGILDISGKSFPFIFDSGSECSLMKESVASNVNGKITRNRIILVGIGKSDIASVKHIQTEVKIRNLSLIVILHVIPDDCLNEPILLGRDILSMGISVQMGLQGLEIFPCKISNICDKSNYISNSLQLDTDLFGDNKETLLNILSRYSTHFVEGIPITRVKTGEMRIDLIDPHKTVQRRPYRLSPSERQIVKDKIQELLNANIIRESNSPFASPILLVKKKDGTDRMCVDYRELNDNTRSDHYPLPRIDDQIDRLCGAHYFTSLDMASGFHQIPIHAESIERTAFVTPDGQFEYLTMPFGLKNAPPVFQRSINKALKGCEALVYMDDVLCASETIEQGLKCLEEVLKALTEAGFSLNIKKCHFMKREIDYLGYQIRAGEIRPNPRKIQALVEARIPRTVTQ